MKWKFWGKTEPAKKVDYTAVSVATIARWYLYDTEVSSPETVAKAFGLLPASSEGETTELMASEIRRERVDPYLDFITLMSEINAKATMEVSKNIFLSESDMQDAEKEEIVDMLSDVYSSLSYAALYAAFSAALEIGIIKNPGLVGSTMKDSFDD